MVQGPELVVYIIGLVFAIIVMQATNTDHVEVFVWPVRRIVDERKGSDLDQLHIQPAFSLP